MKKFNECVMYQLFLRPFTPEGTLKGAEKMLPHLKDMGVDIVYLCPITYSDEDPRPDYWSNRQRECGFGNPQNPYRMADYYRVDPEYGTDDDLSDFVRAAHALDMYVLLDLVYMHCGPSCHLLSEHPDYFKRDENGELTPNMYRFYDFDFTNPQTRDYFRDNMIYFVRRFDVDGYRCDCGDVLPAEFWKESIDAIRAFKPGIIMLNEGGKTSHLEAGFDVDYGCTWPTNLEKLVTGKFWGKTTWTTGTASVLEGTITAKEVLADIKKMADNKPEGKLGILSLENHDFANDAWYHRVETMVPPQAMECAMAVNFTAKGCPFLYTGVDVADGTRHSILGNRKYAPNCRVNWSNALTPVGQNRMAFLRAISAVRHENPALAEGDMQIVAHNCEEKVMAFTRSCDRQKVLVLVNFSDQPMEVQLAEEIPCGKLLYARDAEGYKLGGYGILVAQIG